MAGGGAHDFGGREAAVHTVHLLNDIRDHTDRTGRVAFKQMWLDNHPGFFIQYQVVRMFPKCSLNVECFLNVPWMFPECSLNVP
jgi:hypothetical protein